MSVRRVLSAARSVRLATAFLTGFVFGVPLAGAAVSPSSSIEPLRRFELPDVKAASAPRLPTMPKPRLEALAPIRPAAPIVKVPDRQQIRTLTTTRRKGLDDLILETARHFHVEAALVKAVIHAESRFDPRAVSHRGAVGLMQLMPRTARSYGVRSHGLTDPRQNIRAGVLHLKKLLARHRDVSHAIAAYNAGSPTVRRYRGIPPYPETRTYVSRVLRYRGMYRRDPIFAPVAAQEPEKPSVTEKAHEDMGTRG